MRILRHFGNIPPSLRRGVVVIGNFDGVHRGHRAVIEDARAAASALGAPLVVLTFEPHPREFFAPNAPPFRLTPFRTKAHLLQRLGPDLLLAITFDQAFSQMTAEAFVTDVLVDALAARRVVVGFDFAFGNKRAGNADLLQRMGAADDFEVEIVAPVGEGPLAFSSTHIRDCLWQGRPGEAAALLGHWWEIEGRVQQGDRRGRQIGFPTANFSIAGYLEPTFGVYAVHVGEESASDVRWRGGVANLGRRPTFGKDDVVLEVHLFDFDGDLYGRQMRIAFVEFIRPEQRFDGIEALRRQIAADAARARDLLAKPSNRPDAFET